MTKEKLLACLRAGKTMDSLFPYTSGQECLIFKAESFTAGEEITYIPDVSLNNIPMDRPLENDEEIRSVIDLCYTGADFMEECGGNVELARQLFFYCDWQHPSSALPEVDCGQDGNEQAEKEEPVTIPEPAACEMALPSGIRLRASVHSDSDYPSMSITLIDVDGKQELVCFVEHNPEKESGRELCVGVYCAEEDEPVYYDSYYLEEPQNK